jgi:putative ABC transport system permease protein
MSAFISVLIHLGLERRLVVAAVRMVIQLVLIGMVLSWVFSLGHWYTVVPFMIAISLIGSFAAVQQTNRRYPGVWLNSILSVSASSWLWRESLAKGDCDRDHWHNSRRLGGVLSQSP